MRAGAGQLLAALIFCVLSAAPAYPGSPDADAVKAAFVYQFTKFIEWPRGKLDIDGRPFVIGVAGSERIRGAFAKTLEGRSVKDHPIRLVQVDGAQTPELDLIFIEHGSEGLTSRYLQGPVFSVSDAEGFLDMGGLIELVTVEGRIRFKIDAERAEQKGFTISSKLLTLAVEVRKAQR